MENSIDIIRTLTWIIGGLYIAFCAAASIAALTTTICSDWATEQSRLLKIRARKLTLLFVQGPGDLSFLRREVLSTAPQPKAPRAFVPPATATKEAFIGAVGRASKVLISGQSGSGKTTFAMEMCQRLYLSTSPSNRVPVFASLSNQGRIDNPSTLLRKLIESRISSKFPLYKYLLAKHMLRRGNLLFILDDLDYLRFDEYLRMVNLPHLFGKNSFVYIVRHENAAHKALSSFTERVSMPDWTREQGQQYCDRRLGSKPKVKELLQKLEEANVLQCFRTPLDWKCAADAYEQGRIHQLFRFGGEAAKGSSNPYSVLDHYITPMLHSQEVDEPTAVRELGRISLRLIKSNRYNFAPSEVALSDKFMASLKSRLVTQTEEGFSFIHNNYQILLAGKYLGQFWSEAKHNLEDQAARSLILKPVYDCARQSIPADLRADLEEVFHRLATPS